jgi:hypothetical protein
MPLTMHFTPPDLLIAELDGYPMPKEIAGKLKENKWSGKAPKSYQGAGITEVEKWRGVFGMELDLLAPGLDLGILSGTGKGTRDYTSSFDPSFSCTEEFELDFNYLLTSRKF